MHGNFLTQPVWNMGNRKVPLRADMTQVITKEEIDTLSIDEIQRELQMLINMMSLNGNLIIRLESKTKTALRIT